MKKKYEAMVLFCIDPRFQPIVFNYLKKKNLIGNTVHLQSLAQLLELQPKNS